MGSINNWLAFSLSPLELQSLQYPYQNPHPSPSTVNTNCFSFSTRDSSSETPLNNIDLFNATHHHQHQDWNIKSSENESKLEDFLNGHSYLPINGGGYSLQFPATAMVAPSAAIENLRAVSGQASSHLPLVGQGGVVQSLALENNNNIKKKVDDKCGNVEEVNKRSVETFGQRTSIYRGVTRHRWTGRYEAHLWDNSCKREGQSRKGRQVYLGGYDKEDKAARSYDLAALKYWGATTTTNFPTSNYEKELEEMKHMTRQEYIASLRRKSSGFSRGASIYRGVTRHHQHGRWQARIGRVAGNKDLYLGTFTTQEEAAEAYDIAAIKFRGLNAITNFEMNRYDVKSILESSTLPVGPAAKKLKDASNSSINQWRTDYGNTVLASYPYGYQQYFWSKQDEDSQINNFKQPLMQNVMSSCSTSLELGMGINSNVYNGFGAENILGWPDSYRNQYYHLGVPKVNDYEQSDSVITDALGAPAAPLFTVWDHES